jgi:hypothetical protein
MGVIISFTIGILTLIKKPIKKLTAKIPNEKVRKLANKMFIVFAFGFSFIAWFVLNLVAPSYFSLEGIEVLLTGAFSIVLYALGDGVITKSKAQQLVDTIAEVADDKKADEKKSEKVEKKPESAIKEYLKKVK